MSSATHPERRSRFALVADTLRTHRVSATAWVLGGAAVMYMMGLAIAQEFEDFPGGAKALERSVMPSTEALRIMRWPAEHLDTLGGYLTYHNVTLVMLFLAIYGAVQGSRAVRGSEDRHSLEEILATGWTRGAVIRDRTIGFVIMLAVISLGLGLGTAAAMAGGGEPDLGGSLITAMATGLCGLVGYCLGLLVSQLTRTSRVAAGASSVVLTALYVLNNVWEKLGPFEFVRFASPFYYADFSRALVPGYGLDVPASLAMIAMSAMLFALASLAFQRRDYGAALFRLRRTQWRRQAIPGRGSQRVFGSVTAASLFRGRWGLLAWALGAGSFSATMMFLEPGVIDMWSVFGRYMPGTGGEAGVPIETVYIGFSGEIVALVIVGYVIAQAAAWASDLGEGRAEAVLASPVSWSRLVWERLLASAIGTACIVGGTVAGLALGAASVDVTLDASGVWRLLVSGVLFGAALGGLAAVVVAAFRRGLAVTVLAVLMSASYMQGYLAKIFEWPEWVERSSLFIAFGNPYVDWADTGEILLLLALAIPGALIAAAIAERTPKVA